MRTSRTPVCIDLQAAFGDRYKIDVEASYYVEKAVFRALERPWLIQISCLNGHIGVWDDALLMACTTKPGTVASALKQLPFVEVVADGSDGTNVTFGVKYFDDVASIMKPRKRRQARPMSDEEKRRLVEAGRRFRFSVGR